MTDIFLAVLLACTWADSESGDYAGCRVLHADGGKFASMEECATKGVDAVAGLVIEYPVQVHELAYRYFAPGEYELVIDCQQRRRTLS